MVGKCEAAQAAEAGEAAKAAPEASRRDTVAEVVHALVRRVHVNVDYQSKVMHICWGFFEALQFFRTIHHL